MAVSVFLQLSIDPMDRIPLLKLTRMLAADQIEMPRETPAANGSPSCDYAGARISLFQHEPQRGK